AGQSPEIFPVGPLTGVPEPAALRVALGVAEPNPSSGVVRWVLSLPDRSRVHATVFDAAGARVATIVNAEWPAGRHAILWDRRNERGRRVGAGVDFVEVEIGDLALRRPAVILR